MKSAIYLRIAALLTLIHAILHTVDGVFGKPSPGTAAMVVATMHANRISIMGANRSYADFYFGFGIGITIFMAVLAILTWHLSNLAKERRPGIRPMIVVLMVGWAAFAIDSYFYFFGASHHEISDCHISGTVPAGLRYQEDDVDLCIACTPIKYHREGLSAMKCKILCLIILLTATSAFPQADQLCRRSSTDANRAMRSTRETPLVSFHVYGVYIYVYGV